VRKACFRWFQLLFFLGLATTSAISPASAQEKVAKLKVVATFSILGDFARNVGGNQVDVTSLVGPNGDVHVYTPTPADAEAIRNARLVIVNGLGLELVTTARRIIRRQCVHRRRNHGMVPRTITAGEILIRDHGAFAPDPHAWQSVPNAEIYVVNIRNAMVAADPANTATYRANAAAYLTKLEALDHDVREAVARIPAPQLPGVAFYAVMTPISEEVAPPITLVGQGGISNGLYSIHIRMLDGIDGGNTGVMMLHDGRIHGGDAFFDYVGSYTSVNGRWKGELVNHEHTPSIGERPVFGGYEVGVGLSASAAFASARY
jgi:zinc/manganese transport system substrate-binding protein